MARKYSDIRLRYQGEERNSKHNTPLSTSYIISEIKKLDFVRFVGRGNHWDVKYKNRYRMKIPNGMDDLRKSFHLTINGKKYGERIYVTVYMPEKLSELEWKCIEMGILVPLGEDKQYYCKKLKSHYLKEIGKKIKDSLIRK